MLLVQVQQFGTDTRYELEILDHSVIKMLKLRDRKFWWLIPTLVEVTGEKLVGGALLHPSHTE